MRMRKCQYHGCSNDSRYRCVICKRLICGGHLYQPLNRLSYIDFRGNTKCGNCQVPYVERSRTLRFASGRPDEKIYPGYYAEKRGDKRDLIEW